MTKVSRAIGKSGVDASIALLLIYSPTFMNLNFINQSYLISIETYQRLLYKIIGDWIALEFIILELSLSFQILDAMHGVRSMRMKNHRSLT